MRRIRPTNAERSTKPSLTLVVQWHKHRRLPAERHMFAVVQYIWENIRREPYSEENAALSPVLQDISRKQTDPICSS